MVFTKFLIKFWSKKISNARKLKKFYTRKQILKSITIQLAIIYSIIAG
jgi:hypothetical protein